MDNGFEKIVKKGGPNQIIHLILEERVENVHFGEVSNFEDLKD